MIWPGNLGLAVGGALIGPALPWFGSGWRMSWFGRRGKSVGSVGFGPIGAWRWSWTGSGMVRWRVVRLGVGSAGMGGGLVR